MNSLLHSLTSVLAWLAIPVAVVLGFHFFGLLLSMLKRKKTAAFAKEQTDFACIITAYKNIDIARGLIASLQQQRYKKYSIYLVADDCPDFLLEAHPNLTIIRPEKKLGSKVKSLIAGINAFTRRHEAIVVFDPDNLAHPYFLSEINDWFKAGYKAVQGQRVAKNLDTVYACMDAIGEYYYNYAVREVPFRLGSSATISGSAMGIETGLFNQYIAHLQKDGVDRVIPAEDKILQIFLVDNNVTIAYAPDAIVFDEKVSGGAEVARQRTRWLNAWFSHTGHGLKTLTGGISAFSLNRFWFGLLNIYPPMFMIVVGAIGVAGFAILVSIIQGILGEPGFFLSPARVPGAYIIASGLFFYSFNFVLSLKLNHTPAKVMQALVFIPKFVFNQFLALLQIKKSDKDFMATTHKAYLNVNEVMLSTTHSRRRDGLKRN